jgi:iron(III) transport system substrate-binding protein
MRTLLLSLVCLGFFAVGLALLGLSGCGGPDDKFVIYTSIYPRVIERMKPDLAKAFPGVEFEWRQAGSEQLARKLSVELEAGGTRCDLLMTSDPFYYAQLAAAGYLTPHESAAAEAVPAGMKDAAHHWATVRVPLMVIGVNHEKIAKSEFPSSFQDLLDPRFKGKIAMGDPLKSGTNFTTVASLVRKYGWDYFRGLAKNGIQSAGGNSTVTNKLETGERPIGIVLLENLLPRIEAGAPISIVYPSDGAVPVPSPVAILKASDQQDLARRVHDYFFSQPMQDAIVGGYMYSPLPSHAAPDGGRAWGELERQPFDADFMAWVKKERDSIKETFGEILSR